MPSRRIAVAALHFAGHAGIFVALERSHVAKAGLDTELEFFQAAPPMAAAIASGVVDCAVTAMSGELVDFAKRDAARIVGGARHRRAEGSSPRTPPAGPG